MNKECLMNREVDSYLDELPQWKNELTLLRELLLSCGLDEEIKWKHPCYTYKNKNIALLQEFKEYCAVLFPKGALLHDSGKLLVQNTPTVQAARQLRFTNASEIKCLEKTIKAYVYEAVEVEKAGLKVKFKETKDFDVPEELIFAFEHEPKLKTAFEQLTPGRQRGYLLFFSQAKQAKTRENRIMNNRDRILKGLGLNDCDCGLSKRMPSCDGSHKSLRKN